MTWDWSIYPEIRDDQRAALFEIGLTLTMLHAAEKAIQSCLSWVFADENASSWQDIARMAEKDQCRTLGQLLRLLAERAEVRPEFRDRLFGFLKKRNRFIHGLFNEPDFNLDSPGSVRNVSAFLVDFQNDLWDVQNTFMQYGILFSKALGVHDEIMAGTSEHARKHLEQLMRNFNKVMEFKDKGSSNTASEAAP